MRAKKSPKSREKKVGYYTSTLVKGSKYHIITTFLKRVLQTVPLFYNQPWILAAGGRFSLSRSSDEENEIEIWC